MLTAQSGQVQTGPIDEPRRAQNEPARPIPKGGAAITQELGKCATRLIVNADALFKPERWTLNPDAAQTLTALGPLIVKSGERPARIIASTAASNSANENRDVSQRRALTVRTWLVNHHYVSQSTTIEAVAEQNQRPKSPESSHVPPGANGIVEVRLDTCARPTL